MDLQSLEKSAGVKKHSCVIYHNEKLLLILFMESIS